MTRNMLINRLGVSCHFGACSRFRCKSV